MTEPLRDQTILIVDEDLGFLLWMAELLSQAGCRAVPGVNCGQAMSHVKKWNARVDIAIVNTGLPGMPRMLQTLSATNDGLRIVVIRNPGDDNDETIAGSQTLEKPRTWELIARLDWLPRVLQALEDAPPLASKATVTGRSQ